MGTISSGSLRLKSEYPSGRPSAMNFSYSDSSWGNRDTAIPYASSSMEDNRFGEVGRGHSSRGSERGARVQIASLGTDIVVGRARGASTDACSVGFGGVLIGCSLAIETDEDAKGC